MEIPILLTRALGTATDAGLVGSFLLRGAVLLTIAALASLALRRAPAAVRHHAWVLATVGLLVLPVLTVALPGWQVAVEVPVAAVSAMDAAATHSADLSSEGMLASGPSAMISGDQAEAPSTVEGAGTLATVESTSRTASLPWSLLAFSVWLTGALLLSGRLAIGLLAARRLVRRARPVEDRRWTVQVSLLSLKAGLDRNVRVVTSPEIEVPMAWGIFGAWLVLPGSIDDWNEERRRVVVLHELAHLKRRDCLVRALSQFAAAVHWPNPLAWLAAGRIAAERERACDDAVLAAGTGGATYARHLVDVARGITRSRPPIRAAVAMARMSDLEERVVAILDARRSRGAVGRRTARLGLIALAGLVLPLGLVQPTIVEAVEALEAAGVTTDGLDVAATEEEVDGAATVEEVDGAATTDSAIEPSPAGTIDVRAPRVDSEAESGSLATTARATAKSMVVEMSALQVSVHGADADTIEEKVFQALVKALGSDDPSIRRRAAETFGQIESVRAVEPLARALSDVDDGVRRKAAWALGMIESSMAVEALGRAAGDANPSTRKQVAWALGMIESREAVPSLTPLLRDGEASVRKEAAWALGMIESSEAVEALSSAFSAEASARVRQEIVWALGMIEDRSATDTIVDAIEDPDPGVRDKAMWALGQIMG